MQEEREKLKGRIGHGREERGREERKGEVGRGKVGAEIMMRRWERKYRREER